MVRYSEGQRQCHQVSAAVAVPSHRQMTTCWMSWLVTLETIYRTSAPTLLQPVMTNCCLRCRSFSLDDDALTVIIYIFCLSPRASLQNSSAHGKLWAANHQWCTRSNPWATFCLHRAVICPMKHEKNCSNHVHRFRQCFRICLVHCEHIRWLLWDRNLVSLVVTIWTTLHDVGVSYSA